MKLVYPSGEASAEQIEPLLRLAIEGRKRVKDQLCRIDTTMTAVDFAYTKRGSETPITVKTFEEIDYPKLYWRQHTDDDESDETIPEGVLPEAEEQQTTQAEEDPSAAQPTLSPLERRQALAKPGEVTLDENDRGWSYNKLFGPYVAGAQHLELTDPYIRVSHQMRNLAEFLEMVGGVSGDGAQQRRSSPARPCASHHERGRRRVSGKTAIGDVRPTQTQLCTDGR